jgi:hypothetical protein
MPARPAPFALLAALPFAITGCAASKQDASDPAAKARPVTVLGEAQTCIQRSQIRQSVVRSDSVIDFEMNGGKVYRVTLPDRCPGLGFERAFTFQTSIDQLCNVDIIYVLLNIGGVPQRGAGCGLGPFVPVEYVKEPKD